MSCVKALTFPKWQTALMETLQHPKPAGDLSQNSTADGRQIEEELSSSHPSVYETVVIISGVAQHSPELFCRVDVDVHWLCLHTTFLVTHTVLVCCLLRTNNQSTRLLNIFRCLSLLVGGVHTRVCTTQSVGYLRVDTVCESRFNCALI